MQIVDGFALPSSMGFEQEEWFPHIDGHGPYYTCVCNGRRVLVYDRSIDGATGWGVQLASERYRLGLLWGEKICDHAYTLLREYDDVTLMSLVHHMTSGGNDARTTKP